MLQASNTVIYVANTLMHRIHELTKEAPTKNRLGVWTNCKNTIVHTEHAVF